MITITECSQNHLPNDWPSIGVAEGMTLRRALATIRAAGRRQWGNMGSTRATLSDGSSLLITLQAAGERGSQLLASQRIERRAYDQNTGRERIMRVYQW